MSVTQKSILIVAPSWIGDTIMAQPLFTRLRQINPNAKIDVMAPAWAAPVLKRMAEVDAIIDNPFAHGELNIGARFRFARSLASTGYDEAYVLPNSLKSALIPFFAGIPTRIGFKGEQRYLLVNKRHHLNKTALPKMVERFAILAQAPGTPLTRPVANPRLLSSDEQQTKTLNTLGIAKPEKVAILCPGAEYGPAKRWPAEHFAALAKRLSQEGYSIWCLGSEKDRPLAESITKNLDQLAINFCGKTSLAQAIDLIALSQFVVCNDSGLMHVAAALDKPTVALYGSSSPTFTPPLSEHATILSLNLPCSPCFKRVCPLGHLDCLNKLPPELVFTTCMEDTRS